MKNRFLILLSFMFFTVPPARSQEQQKVDLVRANKKGRISVNFDDELVKGGTMLPEGDLIQNRTETRFKRLIKIRKDFIQDVENSKDAFGNR